MDTYMKIQQAAASLLLFSAASFVSAADAPFTCTEFAIFAHGFTVARDMGQPKHRAVKIIEDDPNFSKADKASFKKMIERIYEARSVDPETMGKLARAACLKGGNRKP